VGLLGPLGRFLRTIALRPRRAWNDEARLRLPGVEISFRRASDLGVPHELSFFIPRMEVRLRHPPTGGYEVEVVLSSVTVVHSPRPDVHSHRESLR
jgi:hypothetical protein